MMRTQGIHAGKALPHDVRTAGISAILLSIALLAGAALTIPFAYETQTLWYKFGTDKILLRTGQMVGLSALVCLCLQVLLAARLTLFDRLLGLDKVYVVHRYNGVLVFVLALAHVSLVLIPEGLLNLPIGKKYWPEMVGAGLLLVLSFMIGGAVLRERGRVRYSQWRKLHRPMGYLVLVLVVVHALYVSDSFRIPVPRYSLLLLVGFVFTVVCLKKLIVHWGNRSAGQIIRVTPLTDSVTGLTIHLPEGREFSYLPGQFAFIQILGDISGEPHPFTIASAPTHSNTLQFIIKNNGDWTSKLGSVKVGDRVRIEGPYGLFNYMSCGGDSELILIAGGIGITPMLSMLRFMTGAPSTPEISLIWSISRSTEMFLKEEFEEIQKQLPRLKLHLVYTRERLGSRRLDMDKINSLTEECSRSASIFVCGPPQMIERTIEDCASLGFSTKNMFSEKFGF
jgi:predicted ferric reductase